MIDFVVLAPFYIAADNKRKEIIVAIRGTLSATDILTDINAVEDTLNTELFGNGYCHSGKFYLYLKHLFLINLLSNIYENSIEKRL